VNRTSGWIRGQVESSDGAGHCLLFIGVIVLLEAGVFRILPPKMTASE